MKTSEVLRKARELITPEGSWTQGALFRDKYGESCNVREAVCYCASGALGVANKFEGQFAPAYRLLSTVIDCASVSIWNDSPRTTHAMVLNAFDRAIELAEAREAREA